MADNDTDTHNEAISEQQQQQKATVSQPQPSTSKIFTQDDECNKTSSVGTRLVESQQKKNRLERFFSDRSRKVACAKENEQILSGKFDFGDRDEKPVYNIALPLLKEDESREWTIDELKTLHDCINSHGINDNCLFHATKGIPDRSLVDIREKISGIRELMRVRHEMRVEARRIGWLEGVVLPSKTSEIQDWSSALHVIQNRKRRINDYTDSALLDYFAQEVKCRPASVNTRKYFRVTDSSFARSANKKQIVDCADYYRFLQICLLKTATLACKPFDSAIILNILEEIQKEVDDPKHEKRRRMLAGMFREIQSGDLSDYDFRDIVSNDDMLCLQLNPLGLMREMLKISNEQCWC